MKYYLHPTCLAVALAIAGLAGAPVSASAASPDAVQGAPGQQRVHTNTATAHKLVSTYIDTGTGGFSLAAGFTTIDTNTVTCANAAGCTITFGLMLQAGAQTSSGNEWAICSLVDGNYTNPGCPYQNELPVDGTYQVGNTHQSYQVAKGTHTVTTEIFVSAPADMAEWEADYSVYKP